MGAGMDKILDGLYVGSIRDSKDVEQLTKNKITHILTIYEDPKPGNIENIKYRCFKLSDHASEDIKQYFVPAIDFIHNVRVTNGSVLVHCLAGISRSTTLVIAYLMVVTEMPWHEAMNAVRGSRKNANPNFGFQKQLQSFEYTTLKSVRESLYSKYGPYDNTMDVVRAKALLETYKQSQNELESSSQNAQINVVNKTYPLAYNAYNLDEKDQQGETTAKTDDASASVSSEASSSPSTQSSHANTNQKQPVVTTANVSEDPAAKAKVLDELFDK